MKKSQVLAALALAFALGLGVIAPVANTYATITSTAGVSDEQIAAANKAATEALDSIKGLENIASYKELYNTLGGENGVVAGLNKIAESEVRLFNDNMAQEGSHINSTNWYIRTVNAYLTAQSQDYLYAQNADKTAYLHTADGKLDESDYLQSIPEFKNVTTLKDAYDAVAAAQKIVRANASILATNYKAEADDATVAKIALAYSAVYSHLTDWMNNLNNALQNGQYWDFGTKAADGTVSGNGYKVVNTNTATANAANLANVVMNISTDAYNAIVNNANWKQTPANGVERATDLSIIINVVKTLPKYNYVGAVVSAEANVQKVTGNAENVSYSVAQGYIAALNAAVEAYKNGTATTPTDPTDPEGPNDTDKPGDADDNKGDGTNPGNTGVVSNTNGTASSTVAVVAGIATALTAAGAGVVAYRNARREA